MAVERESPDPSVERPGSSPLAVQRQTMAAILDATVDHISVIGRDGRYLLVNEAAARAVGLKPEAMVGRTWRELGLRASSFERIDAERESVMASGRPERHELTLPGPAGIQHFEYVLAPVRGETGEVTAVVAINREVTGPALAEEERARLLIAERAARAAAERAAARTLRLQTVTAALSEAATAAEVAAVILDQGLAALGARAGAMALVTPAGDELELLHAAGFPPGEVTPWRRFPLASPVALADAVRTGEPVVLLDHAARVARYPGRFLPDPAGDGALVAVPLVSARRAMGGFGMVFPEGHVFDDEDLRFALTLAQQCTQALERSRLYQAERQARIDAEVQNRAKDEFLAMLGHELRNPLAPTLHALEVLRVKGGDDPAARGWAIEMLERQARHMARLVDDLLDVSRITRGQIELRREPAALAALIERAVESCQALVDERRHRLELRLPDEPVWIDADPARIEQVLCNLLNNAARYTPPGGRIRVRMESTGGEAVVTVTDDGAGIPPEMLTRIFDLFHQVDPSLARSQGGLGIGLTLVRRLVEMHGGSVEARSAGAGLGSELTVRLPVCAPPPRGAEIAAETVPGPAARPEPRRRVLVVEDNPDSATALSELLRLWGHEVRVAHDGPAGVAEARRFAPDLVLLDIGLPGMDGYQVALALRGDPALAGARLVALTGYGQEQDHRRSREVGIDRHMTKPIDLAALRELLAG